jgi:aspartyl/asparaginyl beta-hydroxylase (cupin superfamily)
MTYLQSFVANDQNPRMTEYPGLRGIPWHAPGDYPIVRALEEAFPDIRREVSALDGSEFHREAENLYRTGNWDVFFFYERGRKNIENCRRCPSITRIVEQFPAVRTLSGLIYVSQTKPGTHIASHHGPTNLRVRCHLGLEIPEGDCKIRVAEETRGWEEGKCIVFDDRFSHEAWNHTEKVRKVLVVDLWHPDLTAIEIDFLQGLHRYAAAHGGNLNRYWQKNENAREGRT